MDADWTSSRHYGRHGDINGFWILMIDDLVIKAPLRAMQKAPPRSLD